MKAIANPRGNVYERNRDGNLVKPMCDVTANILGEVINVVDVVSELCFLCEYEGYYFNLSPGEVDDV